MKGFFLIFVALLLLSYKEGTTRKTTRVMLLFDKQGNERPLANTEQTFWLDADLFDTIVLKKADQIRIFEDHLSRMKRIFQSFSFQVAAIRYTGEKISDTLYADAFMTHWKISNRFYEDTSDYFRTSFTSISKVFLNSSFDTGRQVDRCINKH